MKDLLEIIHSSSNIENVLTREDYAQLCAYAPEMLKLLVGILDMLEDNEVELNKREIVKDIYYLIYNIDEKLTLKGGEDFGD